MYDDVHITATYIIALCIQKVNRNMIFSLDCRSDDENNNLVKVKFTQNKGVHSKATKSTDSQKIAGAAESWWSSEYDEIA